MSRPALPHARPIAALLVAAAMALPLHAAMAQPTGIRLQGASAVRMEQSSLGRASLRTDAGEPIGAVGIFTADLDRLASSSPAARAAVRDFRVNRSVGQSLILGGAALAIGAWADYARQDNRQGMTSGQAAAFMGGAGAAALGGFRVGVGYRQLARAIHLYNEGESRR